MNWKDGRPENWQKLIAIKHGAIPPRDANMLEAGADAMYQPAYEKGKKELLEVLRKEPIDLEQLRIFCKYADVPLTIELVTFKGVKGKVVFTPDEEVNNSED